MANLPLTEIVIPDSEDVLELAPDLSDEVTALQGAVNTLNTDVSNIPNGTYPNLTAGSILTDKYDIDTTPYLYRAMPYVSKRLEESLVGGSVVWNQLAGNSYRATQTKNNVAYTPNNDGTFTLNGTADATDWWTVTPFSAASVIGHKYIYWDANRNGSADTFGLTMYGTSSANAAYGNKAIIFNADTANRGVGYYYKNGATINNVTIKPQLVDLTAMFGTTIADYVYSLEQATAGSGIAWLKSYGFFAKPYYDYDTGTIKSVEATAHVTRGVNAWDEEWELGTYSTTTGEPSLSSTQIRCKNYIPVLPSTSYYVAGLTSGIMRPVFYDAAKNFISVGYWQGGTSNNPQATPENARYMRFYLAATYGTTYNNDICINISDSELNGKYFPYEEHTYPLGDVTLRGIPKLVNNELVYDGDIYTHDGGVQRNTIFRAYQAGDESLANALTDGTNTVVYSANASNETTTPFEQYQICTTGGTEEYTTTNDVPVGHETKYFTDVIGNIENIPAPPTTNGTYTLQVTVSASGNTYAWV